MNPINMEELSAYIKARLRQHHDIVLFRLRHIDLKRDLLQKKNPYLYFVGGIDKPRGLIIAMLDAKISASEEKFFGDAMEDIAIFIAMKTLNAKKSSAHGPDLELEEEDGTVIILISVKSGPNWGNSSQWKALDVDFKTAGRILRQSPHVHRVEFVSGACYGRAKKKVKENTTILLICGKDFWEMLTGDENFYIKLLNIMGEARRSGDEFNRVKQQVIDKLTERFIGEYCDHDGQILWDKILEANSKNLTRKHSSKASHQKKHVQKTL